MGCLQIYGQTNAWNLFYSFLSKFLLFFDIKQTRTSTLIILELANRCQSVVRVVSISTVHQYLTEHEVPDSKVSTRVNVVLSLHITQVLAHRSVGACKTWLIQITTDQFNRTSIWKSQYNAQLSRQFTNQSLLIYSALKWYTKIPFTGIKPVALYL